MQKRTIGYDFLRIISIIGVVAIHSNSAFLWASNARDIKSLVMLELTALCVTSVPVFFMLSGALLLDVKEEASLHDLFFHRIRKQCVPFIIWSLIYLFARALFGFADFRMSDIISLLHEPAYAQFWFMYTLLAIYLILPFVQILVKNISKKQYTYLLIIWLLFSCVIPTISKYNSHLSISNHVDLVLCEGYIGFFLLGFFIKKYCDNFSTKTGVLLFLLGTIITAVLVFYEWKYNKNAYAIRAGLAYGSYLFPGSVIASAGMFIVFQNTAFRIGKKAQIMIATASQWTVGVFYIHMLILVLLEKTVLTNPLSIMNAILKCFVTVIISYTLTGIMIRIPGVSSLLLGIARKEK